MKNIFITLLIYFFGSTLLYGQTKNLPFQLHGVVTGTPKDSVIISYYNDNERKMLNRSLPVLNGEFNLKGFIDGPKSARISFKQKGEAITKQVSEIFYMDPAVMTMNVDPAKLKELKLTGSSTQQDYDDYNNMVQPVRARYEQLASAIKAETDVTKQAALKKQRQPALDAITNTTYDFFISHPRSFVTEDMLQMYSMMLSDDSTKRVFNALPAQLKQNNIGKAMSERFAAKESVADGKMVKGFKTVDVDNKPLSLDQYKGKYLILDFWASWCVPCRKSHPALRKIYARYHKKGLEIIGIADDVPRPEIWRKAIAQDSIGIWHHVLDGVDQKKAMSGIKNPNDIMALYGVTALPTKFLVDPQGKIIMKEIGDDMTAMANKLAELIDKTK